MSFYATDKNRRFKITLWFIVFIILPFVSFFNWIAVYFVFGTICVVSTISPQSAYSAASLRIPALVKLQFCILIALLPYYIESTGTIINIGAIIFIETVVLWMVTVPCDPPFLAGFFRTLLVASFIVVILGAFVSVIFSGYIEIENPINDFLIGDRVRLLAYKAGHSILIDMAFIILIVASSNVARLHVLFRFLIALVSVLFIYLAKSSAGYILIATSIFVFLTEYTMPTIIRSIMYIMFFALLVGYFFDASLFSDLIFIVRSDLQGADPSAYAGGDFTAGRSELNQVLLSLIGSSPIVGVGHEHPLIKYGVAYLVTARSDSDFGAVIESGLRLAAKYGIPYFLCVVAFILQPTIDAFKSQDRSKRIFNASLSLGLLSLTAVNSQLEVPHQAATFIYFSLLALTTSPQYLKTAVCEEPNLDPDLSSPQPRAETAC